jgi:pimeloyl-ACP methyl ester carboxylesterase
MRSGVRAVTAAAALGLFLAGCATLHGEPAGAAQEASAALFMDCRGPATDKPTVVLEAGVFGTSADWDNILREQGHASRICAYDRAGLGASGRVSGAHNALDNARLLARRLDLMGETGPVILVGHSNGGLYAQTFATLYPGRVAGLVYVNGVGVDDLDSPILMKSLRQEADFARFALLAGRLHLTGLAISPVILALELAPEAAQRKRDALTSIRHLTNGAAESVSLPGDLAAVRAAGAVPADIPVVAIVSVPLKPSAEDSAWRSAEAMPVRHACQGWLLEIRGGDHVSPLARDKAYLLAALTWLHTPGLRDPARPCTDKSVKG